MSHGGVMQLQTIDYNLYCVLVTAMDPRSELMTNDRLALAYIPVVRSPKIDK